MTETIDTVRMLSSPIRRDIHSGLPMPMDSMLCFRPVRVTAEDLIPHTSDNMSEGLVSHSEAPSIGQMTWWLPDRIMHTRYCKNKQSRGIWVFGSKIAVQTVIAGSTSKHL